MAGNKGIAFVAVFFGIIGFVIALLAAKKDKYVMYYAKQGLVLTILGFACSAVMIIPILGWIAGAIGSVVVILLWIIALINSVSGEQKPLPLLQQFADKLDL